MTSLRRDPSPSPSISSMVSDSTSDLCPEEIKVRNYAKKKLEKRLFLGHYQERRYVESLCVYRDMVVLHRSETDLKVDLDMVHSKLRCFYGIGKWLGITNPDIIGAPAAGHCLWTKLQDVAFGFYWFQLRQVRIEEREISVRLKVIRRVDEDVLSPSVSASSLTKSISENVDTIKHRIQASIHSLTETSCLTTSQEDPSSSQLNPTSSLNYENHGQNSKQNEHNSETKGAKIESPAPDSTSNENSVKTVKKPLRMEDFLALLRLMLHSWKEILTVLSSVLVGIINGTGKCVEFIGNFSLKFMREVNSLLRTLTPIVLAVIELVGKMIGGIYLLFGMLIQSRNRPLPPRPYVQPIQNRRPLPALRYGNDPCDPRPRRPLPPGMRYIPKLQ